MHYSNQLLYECMYLLMLMQFYHQFSFISYVLTYD